MKTYRANDSFNKINTKEELIELLNNYKGILNNVMIDYLNSLINLDFSVIRDYIDSNDRVALSELEVYKRIAMYNIYNRALNIFRDNSEVKIQGNNDGKEGLAIYLQLQNYKLFEFNYFEIFNENQMPDYYKSTRIGNISLFETMEDIEKREEELNRVMTELEKLYSQKNPYPDEPGYIGGPRPQWEFNHSKKIGIYEQMFNELLKKELTDGDKKEFETIRKYNELLLSDYGLTNNDFEDVNISKYELDRYDLSGMQKKKIKRMPDITITKNIKYI